MSLQSTHFLNLEKSLNDFPEDLRKALSKIITKEGYVCCNVTKRALSTKGGNFLGILHAVDIKGTTNEGEKEINIFVKQANIMNKINAISIADIYSNEVYVYSELAKVFTYLQNEASIPDNERFKMANSYNESNDKAIILENLVTKGYKSFNRLEVMSLKFAELSVEQLAKFHGLSFVMQRKRPDFYEKRIKNKKWPVKFDSDWNVFITNICNKAIEVLDSKVQGKVKKLLPTFGETYRRYLNDNAPVWVLCHGDVKVNNIMMKEINSEITEVMLLDYQFIYHGCPINDFIYFIFSSTDQKLRREHLGHLKCLYYESLKNFLEYFNMDVELIFPRKLFEQIYEDRLDYGLLIGLYLSYFMFVPEDELPDTENIAMADVVFNPSDKCKKWVRELIDDFILWGYL
ncbi:unnamed protein product [Parnassius apollo]|uniref:(apollo) hypothetical protein n=1 Tax=Parnassius apollo TaxID=110799 RepID=A0A8S3W8Q4_PARAO|nr:unnamed protein product [Parnassius apollo]